ncbi:hypothetical protein [Vagococcus jeotgali]|uniref:hypothetical protein n=1 Tax=Vagococcus jeotgali TaxID=3109030 RepID=UPI002DDB94CE|nr:hypothetical protein [Vagococcus sp. B2T-5]
MDEYKELLEKGKLCVNQGDYEQAATLFDEYFEKTQDFKVHPLLVDALLKSGDEDEGFLRVLEYDQIYQTTPQLYDMYFNLMLKRKLYLRVGMWLNNLSDEEKEPYVEMFKSAMIYWTTLDTKEYRAILKEFENVEKLSENDQLRLMHSMSYLTPGDFLDFATSALLVPNLSAIVRPQLADYIIRLKEVNELSFLDYSGEVQSLLASDCVSLERTFLESEVLRKTREYLIDHQPSLIDLVIGTITMHMGLLYPASLKVMSPVDLWVEAYLLTFEVKKKTSYPEDQEKITEIMDIMRLLDKQISDMADF